MYNKMVIDTSKNNNMRNKTRILIVDDDPDIAFTLRVGLETFDHEVDVYTNPKKVLEDFKPNRYDLLIVDIRMPTMTGFELYGLLREIDKRFKICFITSFETYYKSLIEFFPTIDTNCFIKKPIAIDELNSHILKELSR